MSRLLIVLRLPAHVTEAYSEEWLQAALRRLAALDGVERVELSVVRAASRRYPRTWDRLVELELANGTEPYGWVEHGACGEWLADLRSLDLSPAVLLVDAGSVVGREGDA